MKTTKIFITLAAAAAMAFNAAAAEGPAELSKREFRGAWLHTVYQGQYKSQTTEQNKAYLIRQLDSLKAVGVNAVLFQVRPQADAFYHSDLEPGAAISPTAARLPCRSGIPSNSWWSRPMPEVWSSTHGSTPTA